MSYKSLEIWILANELVIEVHEISYMRKLKNYYLWVEVNYIPSLMIFQYCKELARINKPITSNQ